MRKNIFFRADGSSKIGLGHVIRSLALADMLKEDFTCNFVIRSPLETLKKQILEVCESIIVLPETEDKDAEAEFLSKHHLSSEDIIVLDGYQFGLTYQQKIVSKGCKLVCIDDIQHTDFIADAVINHAPGLSPKDFTILPKTRLLLGSNYALLRPAFLQAAAQPRTISEINTVFVCFGGADFNNLSLKVLKLFSAFTGKRYNINMVLGGANDFKDKVKSFAQTISGFTVNLYENLSAEGMVKVMQQSDCAIVPASSIMYEVLAVKMPVIGGYYVDNQVNIYHGFNETKLITGVGDLNVFSDYESILKSFSQEEIISTLTKQGKLSIEKIKINFIKFFKNLSLNKKLEIRRATSEDLMTYYFWANDPLVRNNSISKQKITLEDHTRWFNSKLNATNTIFYIFESEGMPVGQLRFDIFKKEAVINYSVSSNSRGKGYGKIILQEAVKTLQKEEKGIERVTGVVKHQNVSSLKIFEKSGFQRTADVLIDENKYHSFYLDILTNK